MKKMLILTNLVWFSIFVFFACSRPLQVNTTDCKTFCYNYSTVPFSGLSIFAAKTMSNNYRLLSPANETETRSIWFKLETLKNFIYQIENATCNKNCDAIKMQNLGIRFYFAKYPTSADPAANSPEFAFLAQNPDYYGKKTLFMVPTFYDPTNPAAGDVDFDPSWAARPENNSCKPKSMDDLMKRENPESLFKLTVIAPDPNDLQNHGMLCPTRCEGNSF
ncbi:MAG: hypothetical protein U5M51_06395 [Emticicia sp.]|nr:hypothetical protein [Emticicia sp.]